MGDAEGDGAVGAQQLPPQKILNINVGIMGHVDSGAPPPPVSPLLPSLSPVFSTSVVWKVLWVGREDVERPPRQSEHQSRQHLWKCSAIGALPNITG